MNRIGAHQVKRRSVFLRDAALILPAVALGIPAMIAGGVSPALWGQQAAVWVLFALMILPLRRAAGRMNAGAWSAGLLLFLAASLLGQEAGGARRWVNLVVFHANAAQLVLPALIALQCRTKHPYPALLGAAAVLSFQPDISQLTAFCAAALVILFFCNAGKLHSVLCAVLLGALLIRCMGAPTALEPEAYCEGILIMLADLSWVLAAAGGISLALIPLCLMRRFLREENRQLLALAAYYAASMLFVLTGEYPVPFMGFGLSPIAGYYLACICCDAPDR